MQGQRHGEIHRAPNQFEEDLIVQLTNSQQMKWAEKRKRKATAAEKDHERLKKSGYVFIAPNMYVPESQALKYW